MEYAFTNINQDVTWKEIVNSVWHIAPVPPGFLEHPCPYPEEIPYRLLNLYSNEGDVVLDPMVGSGTTMIEAKLLGRKGIGFLEKCMCVTTRMRAALLASGAGGLALVWSWRPLVSPGLRRR